jgi:tetratricopeptide (TPR) repeat protein
MTTRISRTGAWLAAAVLLAACSHDRVARSASYVTSGDRYTSKQQFTRAILEYRNAIKERPDWAEPHYKLAKAYDASGDAVKAYGEYARTADLEPANVDAQVRAGNLLLAAGEFEAAKTRAELALKAAPRSAAANILLGNALAGLNETAKAVKQIEQALALDPSYAPAWSALGAAQFAGGSREQAGAAFTKAVELAPQSIDARLALANYHWAKGDVQHAEEALTQALAIDSSNAAVHRALALLYLATRRGAEAEPHFKALASQPGGELALADYYSGIGRREDALNVLHRVESGSNKSDARAARLRLATLQYSAGDKAGAHKLVDAVIAEKPKNVDARLAKARMLLGDGKPDEAAVHAREAVKLEPDSPAGHYTLGLTAMARNDPTAAEQAFEEVLKINPRAAVASLQIARLRLARGETAGAVHAAEDVSRERPDDVEAAVLLSRSLRAQGDVQRAQREIAARIARQPDQPALRLEMGWLSLQRREPGAARASFDQALRLAPDSYDAREGLVTADVAEKKLDAARARIVAWRRAGSDDPRLRLLSARVDLAGGKTADAERELRALVTADPSQLDAYDLLGRIAMSKGQLDSALAEYKTLADKSQSPAGPLTLMGMIEEARGHRDAARAHYEHVLAADARAGVAANNLAWLYADDGRLDEALKLATVAQEEMRQRPEAEDTLGWVYYRKGLAAHAVAAFDRAVAKAPDNPVYHYHLGLAQLKAGNARQGRAALTRALALKSDFNGADDARRALAQ